MKNLIFIITFNLLLLTYNFCFAQWQHTNGPANKFVFCLAVNGSNIYACTDGGVYLSTNNGADWTAMNSGMNIQVINSIAISGQNIFAGSGGNGMYLSTNNGTNWSAVNQGLPFECYINSITINASYIFTGTNTGFYVSTDNGAVWNQPGNILSDTTVLNSIAVNGSDLFAGNSRGDRVFLSTNNGSEWNTDNNGLTTKSIWSVTNDGANVFAGAYNDLFMTTNGGSIWFETNTGLPPDTGYYFIMSMAISGQYIFAELYPGGVYMSTNNGNSWYAVNTGILDTTNVLSLAFSGTTLYAGTDGYGVFKRSLSDILSVNELNNITYLNLNISPNPVSESSVINYQLSETGLVNLKIIDITGKEVKTIENSVKDKGEYSISYNSSDLNAGIYFLKLTTNNSTRVVKFVKY